MFVKLRVKLFYSTVYHLQTDGSSERTNQTMKIALRFYIHALTNPAVWPEVLTRIQSLLNNTSSSTTGKTSNEIAYGFIPRRPLDLLAAILTVNLSVRLDAADAFAFATANHKEYYDRKHQPLFMKVGE